MALLALGFGLLQTPWAANQIRGIAEREVTSLLQNATLSIGSLSGTLMFGASAHDVRLLAGDSVLVLVDEVDATYNLIGLLFNKVELSEIRITDPQIIMRQRPDTTWDLLSILPESSPSSEPSKPLEVSIKKLSVSGGSAEARFVSGIDSILTVHGLDATVSRLQFVENLSIQGLAVDATGRSSSMEAPINIHLDATFGDWKFRCTDCSLASARSQVTVNGYVDLEEGSDHAGADLSIKVDSFALADVKPLFPELDSSEVVTGFAMLNGTLDSLIVESELSSNESRLAANGVLVRSDTAVVRLDADLLNVDPSHLWLGSPLSGSLSGELHADLKGGSLEELDGEASLRIHDSILNRVKLGESNLAMRMRDGLATVSGNLEMPALYVEVDGRVSPLADTVTWSIEGLARATGFNRAYPKIEAPDSFSLTYDLSGSSASTADYFHDLSIRIDHLVYRDLEADTTVLTARMSGGVVHVDGQGRVVSSITHREVGSFLIDGHAQFNGGTRIELRTLQFDDLDVAHWTGDADRASELRGTVTGNFVIPQDGVFEGTVEALVSGEFRSLPVDSLAVSGDVSSELFDGDVEFRSREAAIDVSGRVRIAEQGFPLAVQGSFEHLDASLFTADSTMRSELNGTMRARSRWTSISNHDVDLTTELDRSAWNDQVISSGSVELQSKHGAVSLTADIQTPQGGLKVNGGGLLSDSSFAINQLDGTFASLRLGDLLGLDNLSTDLNGQLTVKREAGNLTGRMDLSRSVVNRSTIIAGEGTLAMKDDSVRADGNLQLDAGRIRFSGAGNIGDGEADLETIFKLDSVDVAAVAGLDSIDSRVTLGCSIVGKISTWAESDAAGLCLAANSQIADAQIDSARVEVRVKSKIVTARTIRLRSNFADVEGSGTAYFGEPNVATGQEKSDLAATVTVKDLTRLEKLLRLRHLEGEGTIDVSVTGRPGRPDFYLEPHLAFLTYDDVRVSSIDGYVQTSGVDFSSADAVIDVGYSVFSGFPVQSVSMSLLAEPESAIFVTDVVQDGQRRGTLSATYDHTTETPELKIEDLTLNLEGTIWKLSQEAVVQMGDVWEVQQFLIFHDQGQIALDGQIDPDGQQNIILTAEQVETSAFIDLFGIRNVAGALEGYLVLSGPADSLVAESEFRIRQLKTMGQIAGDLSLETSFANGRMTVDGDMHHVSGHNARITGSVPVNISLGGERTVDESDPIELTVVSDSLPLNWVQPFLGESLVSEVDGFLIADFGIAGDWSAPVLSGSGTVTAGHVKLTDFNTELSEIAAEFSLENDVLSITQLSAVSSEAAIGLPGTKRNGSIRGSGSVNFETLADLGLDVSVEFENFRAISTETYRATVSGTASISGSMRAPVVSADVEVSPADIFLTEELMQDETESVALTDRDVRILERRFGYRVAVEDTTTSDFVDAMELSARVNIGHDVWLRSAANPAMDIEFTGNVLVRKAPFEDQRIIGTIDVNPSRSRIVQFARRFGVERGTITFNGLIEDAVVDFRGQYVVPSRFGGSEVKIFLDVTGVMYDLRLEISSQPQMDDATIASYLLTGRPPGEATSGGEQAAEIALGGVTRFAESFASENFGLDVVEIEATSSQGTRLTVGKYISPKTYVYVKQPITVSSSYNDSNGSRSTQIGLEYQLFSWLVTEISSRGGNFRGNLRWQVSF